MWTRLCAVCVHKALGQSWSWLVRGHPFPGGVLATVTSVQEEEGRLEPEPSEQRLLLCSVAVPTLLGWVSPKALEQNYEVGSRLGPTPCECAPLVVCTVPCTAPLPQRWQKSWRKVCRSSWCGQPCMWCSPYIPSEPQTCSWGPSVMAALPRPDVCVPVCVCVPHVATLCVCIPVCVCS